MRINVTIAAGRSVLLLLAAFLSSQLSNVLAQGTAFTYQGRLSDGDSPANGTYDLVFVVYDAPTGPGVFANLINYATVISNGLFTVSLDFDPGMFPGADRWLEVGVRTNGGSNFTMLSPRQKITAAPYAITAGHLNGTISSNNIAAGSITSAMLAAGAVGSNQLAAGAVNTAVLADGAVTAAKIATTSGWFALGIANPTPAPLDLFGYSVAAVGSDLVLIGAPDDDTGANSAGVAYLFNANGALVTSFYNPTPAAFDYFGFSVAALGNDRVIIGAPAPALVSPNSGAESKVGGDWATEGGGNQGTEAAC